MVFVSPPCPSTVLIEAVISVLSAFYDFGRKGYWASEVLQPEIDDADDRYELLMEGNRRLRLQLLIVKIN